uniref:Pallidipin-like salivary lipocalin n=1 Tax=Triatoma matogrossensis TaxID=162370 RepID=E2J719_9HEMI
MIIAVIFFGILTYAFDEYSYDDSVDFERIYSYVIDNSSECKHEPMADFNLTKYLQMTQTYGTYSKYGSVTVCRVLNTEIKECGSVQTNIYGYYQHRKEIYYFEMICNTTVVSMETGEYLADCQMVKDTYPDDLQEYNYDDLQTQISDDSQTHASDDLQTLNPDDLQSLTSDELTKFQLYISVIDTDYKNYAIIYHCMKDEFGIEDNIEIVQTNIFGCEVPIKVVLEGKGEKLEEYIQRNASYCLSHGRHDTTRKEVENNGKQDDKKEK